MHRIRHHIIGAALAAAVLTPVAGAAPTVTVAPGHTLGGIADRHGVAATALARHNGIDDPSRIRVGQVIRIPRPWTTHRVRPGESLGLLAARYRTSSVALARRNKIKDPSLVRAGQILRVPRRRTVAASPTKAAPTKKKAPAWVRYRVRPGESLGEIATRRRTTSAAIARRNRIANPSLVRSGQVIRVPRGRAPVVKKKPASAWIRYRIRVGESLGVIATRRGTTSAVLAVKNGIKNPSLIRVGQTIRVPRGTPGPKGRANGGLPKVSVTAQSVISGGRARPPAQAEVVRAINRAARRYGVDPRLARAISWQESGYQQNVVSATGAVGVMQLMPDTARWLAHDVVGRPLNRHRMVDNVEGGVAFLGWLQRRTSRRHAIAGYYQGLRSVSENGLYGETRDYVANVEALIPRI